MKIRELFNLMFKPQRCALRPAFAGQEPPLTFSLTLLLFTITFYTQLGERIEFLGDIRFELMLGIVLLVMCVVGIMARPPRFANERALLIATLLFVLALVMQVPFAVSVPVAANTFTQWVMKNIMFGFFLAVLIRSPRQLIWFMAAFIFSLFWIYQEAVRGLISGSLVWYNQGIPRLHGSVPLYSHPNGLSLVACYSLPFVLCLLPLWRRTFPVNLFLLATLVLAGLCIVNTGSRAGYVGSLALIPYWIMDGRGRIKRLLLIVFVGLAMVPILPDQYIGRFESIGGGEGSGEDSRQARIQILRDAWAIWQEYPLGLGIDGFEIVRLEKFGRDQDTHNLYAQAATHLGIQGLAAFLAFVGLMFGSLTRSLGRIAKVLRTISVHSRAETDSGMRVDAASYAGELRIVEAILRATRMLLFFMLMNGAFAHTLYLVAWWFLAGVTFAGSGLTSRMTRHLSTVRNAAVARLERPAGQEAVRV